MRPSPQQKAVVRLCRPDVFVELEKKPTTDLRAAFFSSPAVALVALQPQVRMPIMSRGKKTQLFEFQDGSYVVISKPYVKDATLLNEKGVICRILIFDVWMIIIEPKIKTPLSVLTFIFEVQEDGWVVVKP